MPKRKLYLLSYDISDDKRLRAALKCARQYATGGQKSVHECWLTDSEKAELLATLSLVIEEDEDSLLLIRLDPRQQPLTLGRGIVPDDPDWFYLG